MARRAFLAILCVAPALAASSFTSGTIQTDEISSFLQHQRTVSSTLVEIPSFPAFIQELGRTYQEGSEEYEMRSKLYSASVRKVQHHNSNPNRRWTAGINHLSDNTEEELARLRGLRIMQATSKSSQSTPSSLVEAESVDLPDEKLWTNLLATTTDINQGECGSCWAVATATTLWANAEIKGHDHQFSAQELVNCVPNPHQCGGRGGCSGSTVELALNWVMDKGLTNTKETPYQGRNMKCKKEGGLSFLGQDGDNDGLTYNHAKLKEMIAVGFHGGVTPASSALSLAGWERLPENEYEPLKRAVAQVGPVAVSVASSSWDMYSSGIFDSCDKNSERGVEIDHAVALIGYGQDGKNKYWLIKNSYGPHWGEHGTIRLLREENSHGHCGTDRVPSEGTGCDDSPPSVKVCGMCGILYDAVVPHFHKKI